MEFIEKFAELLKKTKLFDGQWETGTNQLLFTPTKLQDYENDYVEVIHLAINNFMQAFEIHCLETLRLPLDVIKTPPDNQSPKLYSFMIDKSYDKKMTIAAEDFMKKYTADQKNQVKDHVKPRAVQNSQSEPKCSLIYPPDDEFRDLALKLRSSSLPEEKTAKITVQQNTPQRILLQKSRERFNWGKKKPDEKKDTQEEKTKDKNNNAKLTMTVAIKQ